MKLKNVDSRNYISNSTFSKDMKIQRKAIDFSSDSHYLTSLYCRLLGKYETAEGNLLILLRKGERKSILHRMEINVTNL